MRKTHLAFLVVVLASALGADSCGGGGTSYPQHLSDWGFFAGEMRQLQPVAGVVPYDVIAALWTDGALKHRFIRLPAGRTIAYDPMVKWTYPVGTVIIKNFGFPVDERHPEMGEQVIETRLLVLETDGWHPVAYHWNAAQTDAVYEDTGPMFDVSYVDATGGTHTQPYKMPNLNQCRTCHGEVTFAPIGARTRQLDRLHDYGSGPENQLDHMQTVGMFDHAPEAPATRNHLSDPFGSDALDLRAKSYLDANCSHCHDDEGHAGRSGFWVYWQEYMAGHDGICKVPESCGSNCGGLQFDIVPGDSAHSIIAFRMNSVLAGERMPELGTLVADDRGVQLIRDWVDHMPPNDCTGRDAGVGDAGPASDAGTATDAGTPDAGVPDGAPPG